jgi:hypothetical protein
MTEIHKFGGQGCISDTPRRAALEREAKNTDIHDKRCYHYVE